MIGTIQQYPTKSDAWHAAEVFRLSANPDNPAQHGVSWRALIERYVDDAMPRRKSTRRGYNIFLNNFIKPKWGEYPIAAVSSFATGKWLKTLMRSNDAGRPLAPKSKVAVRDLMHTIFDCAMRWGLVPLQVNPFGKGLVPIKDATKKLKDARVLTPKEFHCLLRHRLLQEEPSRTMLILAMCLGLRCDELFALRWSDVDPERKVLRIERGIVRGEIDDPKTDSSKAALPLVPELAKLLRKWKRKAPFKAVDDFVFASPLGWHSFRHTYCSLLDDLRAPLRVQQRLMRHADPRQTLKYGKAFSQSESAANQKVVKLVLAKAAAR